MSADPPDGTAIKALRMTLIEDALAKELEQAEGDPAVVRARDALLTFFYRQDGAWWIAHRDWPMKKMIQEGMLAISPW